MFIQMNENYLTHPAAVVRVRFAFDLCYNRFFNQLPSMSIHFQSTLSVFVYETRAGGKQTPYTEVDGFTFPWQQSSHYQTKTRGQKANTYNL